VRKFVIFLVYVAVIGATVYYALAAQPSIDEMLAGLSSHTALPKTGYFVAFVAGHAGAILVFAPFVFPIWSNVVAWLKYSPMAMRLIAANGLHRWGLWRPGGASGASGQQGFF
jgi:hypothetical protein